MKILFITTTFARFAGDPLSGIGNCFYDLYSEMARYAKVDVITPLLMNSKEIEIVNNLTIYREQPIKSFLSLESIIKTLQAVKIPVMLFNMYRRMLSLLNQNNYDVVHGFFIVPAGFLISILPTKTIKVISALGTDVHTLSYKPFMPPFYRFIFRKTDGVIYNTPSMKKRLDQLQVKNLKYIPTPLNRNVFKLCPTLIKKPNFVFVGRLNKAKGVEILLESFKQVLEVLPKAKLTIIGDGPEKNEVVKFIFKNKLNKAIVLAGTLNSKEIANVLKKSYGLLLPSFREGTPASVLEAMSVGRPIVATNVGGLTKLVDKEVGKLTEVGDVNQFTKAILEVYRKNYEPEEISHKTNKFDTKIIAKQYISYYQSLLSEK